MKIDVTQVICDLNGDEIMLRTVCDECGKEINLKPITLRYVCARALTALTEQSRGESATQKFDKGVLAYKITQEDEPELSIEDLALLKKVIGEVDGPLVVFRAWTMLEGHQA